VLLLDVAREEEAAAAPPPSNITRDIPPPSIAQGGAKIKVMKRNTSGTGIDKKVNPDRNTSTFTDKEKAYAEARARIFGPESGSPSGMSDGVDRPEAVPSPVPALASSGGSSDNIRALGGSRETGKESSQTSLVDREVRRDPVVATDNSVDDGAAKKSGTRPQAPAVDPNAWRGKQKVVLRDQEAERSDPDFARHRQPQMAAGYGYSDRRVDYSDQGPYPPAGYYPAPSGYGESYFAPTPVQQPFGMDPYGGGRTWHGQPPVPGAHPGYYPQGAPPADYQRQPQQGYAPYAYDPRKPPNRSGSQNTAYNSDFPPLG
jgi:hypothetical protein